MKAILLFSSSILAVTSLHAQYSASTALLKSGVVHGTERERHFSVRLQALGADFSGFVADPITDMYRNPAYFSGIARPLFFGELVRKPQTALRVPMADARTLALSATTRLGNANRLGLLLRGNYAKSPSFSTDAFETGNRSHTEMSRRDERDHWAEAQIVWGFPLLKKYSAGLSYTYGRNEIREERETASTDYESDPAGTATAAEQESSLSREEHADRSHIIRFGLLRESANRNAWEAVATLELFSADPADILRTRQMLHETQSSPYKVYQTIDQYDRVDAGYLEAANGRLDLCYRNASHPARTFVAQLGLGLVAFSANDEERSTRYRDYYYATASNTYQSSDTSRFTLLAAPKGSGFQIKGGVGWTFQRNGFLFSLAALGSYQRLRYDDVAKLDDYSWLARTSPYDYNFAQYRLALPLGMEYQITSGLHLRDGWVAEFRGDQTEDDNREIDEDSFYERTSRYSSYWLDFSKVTFGMGYQIFERLRADLLNYGNLSAPKDWNVALSYGF